MMDFSAYRNDALGPIQYDEAVFLYGIALKGYQRIDFHTTRKFRHGITILKKPL